MFVFQSLNFFCWSFERVVVHWKKRMAVIII